MSTQLFKGGEEVYVNASKVQTYLANGYSTEPGAPAPEPDAEEAVFSSMTAPKLKAFLAEHEVEVPKGTKKPGLVKLAEAVEVTEEPEPDAEE